MKILRNAPVWIGGGTMDNKPRIRIVNLLYLLTLLAYVYLGGTLVELVKNDLLQIVIVQVVLILPSICYLLWLKQPIGEVLSVNGMSFGTGVLVLLFTALLSPLMTFLNALSLLFTDYTVTDSMLSISEETPFLVMLICVAVIPAIHEEVIYRGVFFQEYRKTSPLMGALLSAFLFGLMHGNLNQFVYTFVLGFAFAMMVEATGTLLSSMLMHFAINGTSVVLMYILPKLQALLENATPEGMGMELEQVEEIITLPMVMTYLVPALIFTPLAVVVYREIAKRCGRYEHLVEGLKEKGRFKKLVKLITIPLLAAVIWLVANIVASELMA